MISINRLFVTSIIKRNNRVPRSIGFHPLKGVGVAVMGWVIPNGYGYRLFGDYVK